MDFKRLILFRDADVDGAPIRIGKGTIGFPKTAREASPARLELEIGTLEERGVVEER